MKQTLAILTALLLAASAVVHAVDAPKPKPAKVLTPVTAEFLAEISAAAPAKAPATPAKPRKVLVCWKCEGFFHAKGIPAGNEAMKILGQKTGAWEVTVVTDEYKYFEPAELKQFDAVILNNTTHLQLSSEQKAALLDFVKSGKGLVGIHSASDNFADWPEGSAMIGGLFDGHPWGANGTWALKLDEPAHPIVKAFNAQNFKIKDEIYQFKGSYSREKCRVLISVDLSDEATRNRPNQKREDKDNAVSWIRPYGKGRVFYCSLGHNAEVFTNPGVLGTYLAGIQYALGDLRCDVSPSKK